MLQKKFHVTELKVTIDSMQPTVSPVPPTPKPTPIPTASPVDKPFDFFVWTSSSSGGSGYNKKLKTTTIGGKQGKRVMVKKVGICGDADSGSGPAGYTLYKHDGSTKLATFYAGQSNSNVKTYHKINLGYTKATSSGGSARGFVYKDITAVYGIAAKVSSYQLHGIMIGMVGIVTRRICMVIKTL